MKKRLAIFGIVFLLIVGVFVTASSENFESDAKKYAEIFAQKMGIAEYKIKNVSSVSFDSLPKEVNIQNIDDTNLNIEQVNYESDSGEKQLFVITYSTEKLRAQGDIIISSDKRQFLAFGRDGTTDKSEFLKTNAGVLTSLNKGYVMMRSGSITGISTNFEALSGPATIEIIIYKNGEAISFSNTILLESVGIKKDSDVQSNGVVTFEPGDLISAYVKIEGSSSLRDIITLVEITTN